MTEKEHKDYWSDCGQVFFTGGRGYAVAPDGAKVDISKEADILKAFATSEIASDLCADRIAVLEQILEYRREVKDNERTNKVKRPGDFRSRPIGIIKHREANLRHPSARKRAAVHKA